MNAKWLRWLPSVIVPAMIAAGVLVGSIPASAGNPLPVKTPAEVLELLVKHRQYALSGTVEQVSELGLPALPKSGPGAHGTTWLELLSSSHTARVFLDGPANARVQVLDRMAERDFIKQGKDLWTYNSRDNTATHLRLPVHNGPRDLRGTPRAPGDAPADKSRDASMHGWPEKWAEKWQEKWREKAQEKWPENRPERWMGADGDPSMMFTPERLFSAVLSKMDANTAVSVGDDVQVAGRAAYNLVLAPRSTVTLLESAALWVDGETGMPLGMSVKARGQAGPAFQIAYTALTLGAPDASMFSFTPPPGATVKELPDRDKGGKGGKDGTGKDAKPEAGTSRSDGGRPTVQGSGWESVLVLPAGTAAALMGPQPGQEPSPETTSPFAPRPSDAPGESAGGAAALLLEAMVPVPGGRLLSTALVNVLVLDDGRVLIGSVPLDRLQAAAAAP